MESFARKTRNEFQRSIVDSTRLSSQSAVRFTRFFASLFHRTLHARVYTASSLAQHRVLTHCTRNVGHGDFSGQITTRTSLVVLLHDSRFTRDRHRRTRRAFYEPRFFHSDFLSQTTRLIYLNCVSSTDALNRGRPLKDVSKMDIDSANGNITFSANVFEKCSIAPEKEIVFKICAWWIWNFRWFVQYIMIGSLNM